MEASANVETDLESVSLTDKENDKISNTIRLDDDVEESKTDVEESFEFINNGEISDTDKSYGNKNITNESVSTSKDIISLDSNVSFDTSEKIVEHSVVGNIEETETGQLSNNDPAHLLNVNADDENLLDEIHSGDFNATSSPVSKSSGRLNTSLHSVDDSFDMLLENDALEEEQDIEEEEEKDHTTDENNDTIVLDDDDEEEENDEDSEDCEDSSESDNEDEDSQDGTDKEENDGYDHKDDDISTLSSEADDVVMIAKEPDQKPKITPPKKPKTIYKKLVKRSIKM